MSKSKYLRPGVNFAAAHATEEAAEVIQSLGKLLRWGPYSYDPEVKPEERETNIDAVRREFKDLCEAMERLEKAIEDEA